jgi:hypothetical protein
VILDHVLDERDWLASATYQARNVNGSLAILGRLLETTTHGEVLVNGVQIVPGVSLRDNLI